MSKHLIDRFENLAQSTEDLSEEIHLEEEIQCQSIPQSLNHPSTADVEPSMPQEQLKSTNRVFPS